GNTILSANDQGIVLKNGNRNLAAPLLLFANAAGGSTSVRGRLDSTPNTTFTLEFFSGPSSGTGQNPAQTLIATASVTTDGTSRADFTITLTPAVATGRPIVPTATDPNNNPSPLSNAVTVNVPPVAALSLTNTDNQRTAVSGSTI